MVLLDMQKKKKQEIIRTRHCIPKGCYVYVYSKVDMQVQQFALRRVRMTET